MGIINYRHKFVFIHSPCCAGSSIADCLNDVPGSLSFEELAGLAEIVRQEVIGAMRQIYAQDFACFDRHVPPNTALNAGATRQNVR